MTFDNYYVSGFKKEGTITWTNTSQGGIKSWERKCEMEKLLHRVEITGCIVAPRM